MAKYLLHVLYCVILWKILYQNVYLWIQNLSQWKRMNALNLLLI
ncbi:hypothetical protein HanXRQr2_Chr04g0179671 [Helianthus annuus]|uniref:Uncharacterized protein n=1 Tax=Helianthus annuus TaxID=4232 RepID=A0A9K3JB64_HELAN|nr:hypothetical protein HanXRQr2_Chr04g0179671 [Helianthus annuus]KAJ0932395.1 hypothetical protein HanPSC8_Chr04g0173161 [Helianthus annuus]